MSPVSNPPTTHPVSAQASALLAQGDERWAQRRPVWRERELALAWPQDLLDVFSRRMESQGMAIHQTQMLCDRRYALQQLRLAHNTADDTLRWMATQLFRHFESRQSGVFSVH